MMERPAAYGFPIFSALAVSMGIAFAWWYHAEPGTIGWYFIIGLFGGPAAIFVFGIAFRIAEKMEKHFSVGSQVAACALLPGVAPTLYLLPGALHFQMNYGADPNLHGVFWHSFGLIIILWVCATAGGLVGGLLLFRKRSPISG
jgi:hypothetical protein